MEYAQTYIAPRVGLPHFEQAFIHTEVKDRYELRKFGWLLKWHEKYPERKIVLLEERLEFHMDILQGPQEEILYFLHNVADLMKNPNFLFLATERDELLYHPRDTKIIASFLDDQLSPEDVLKINEANILPSRTNKLE